MSNNVTEKTKQPATEQTLTPKLRFPEFRDAGEWQENVLYDLCASDLANGVFNDPKKVGTGYKLINVLDMYIDTLIKEENLSLVDISVDEFLKNKVENGDIFFTRSSLVKSGIAYSNLYLGDSNDITFDGHLIRFRPDKKTIEPVFAHYLLKTNRVRSQLVARGKTATMTTIGQADVGSVKLSLPRIPEQQKIADCLSSLDELITTEAQKLDTLSSYKKGLMQQLFPAEGEPLPTLRFPEFQDEEAWEMFTLIQVAKFRRGSFPQPYGLPEWYDEENGTPFVQVFDVDDNLQLKPKTKSKISKLASKQSVFIPKGTVIITIQGSIGRVAITQYDAYIDRTLLLFEEFLKPMAKIFFAYVIQLLFEIERQKAPGGIIKTITKEVLSDFVIRLPHIEEQQKIADCLSSLDELIAAQTQKLERLKQHKKGLMQQLFPTLDEVNE